MTLLHDRYRIVRSIKSGGMGAVYEACDLRLADAPCAVKVILDEANQGETAEYIRSRFRAEMEALGRLQHPRIPRVRDYFEDNGSLYIVMDLIRGRSLDEELRARGPFTAEEVVTVGIQVLEVLEYLHEQSPAMLHRDIKPANLIRDERTGDVVVVDFGLAKQMADSRTQTTVGTLGYCALEQMQGRAEIRSDLYSLGVTMHHLLSGRPPQALCLEPLPEGKFPPRLGMLIQKATAMRAEDRFASAKEMRRELGQAFSSEAVPESAPETRVIAKPVSTGRPVVAVASLGVALMMGLMWLSQQRATVAQAPPAQLPAVVTPSPAEAVPLRQPEPRVALSPKKPLRVRQPDFIPRDVPAAASSSSKSLPATEVSAASAAPRRAPLAPDTDRPAYPTRRLPRWRPPGQQTPPVALAPPPTAAATPEADVRGVLAPAGLSIPTEAVDPHYRWTGQQGVALYSGPQTEVTVFANDYPLGYKRALEQAVEEEFPERAGCRRIAAPTALGLSTPKGLRFYKVRILAPGKCRVAVFQVHKSEPQQLERVLREVEITAF